MAKKPKPLFTGPWYPWYVDDVNESERVGEMSLSEEAAYRRLLDYQWKKGSVPNNAEKLATIVKKRCTPKIAAAVLRMFEPMADDPTRAQNPTLEKRRAEQEEFHNKKVRDGRKGALKRWGKTSYIDSTANGGPIAKNSKYKSKPKGKYKEKEEEGITEIADAIPAASEAKPTKPVKAIDERRDHPAVRAVLEVSSRWPLKDLWNRIIREVGDQPDVAFITACFEKWRSVNGSPMNYEKWLFEPHRTRNLPVLLGEKNGTSNQNGNRTSEREKSGERNRNTRDFADALEQEALARMAVVPGSDDQGHPEIDQSIEQPGTH